MLGSGASSSGLAPEGSGEAHQPVSEGPQGGGVGEAPRRPDAKAEDPSKENRSGCGNASDPPEGAVDELQELRTALQETELENERLRKALAGKKDMEVRGGLVDS